jgi:dipeptidyl-peptidase-4
VAAGGERVVFLRSRGGSDSANCLWALELVEDGPRERLVADPLVLLKGADEELPPEERARRERVREHSGGIVSYATDRGAGLAAFTLSGRLWLADLAQGGVRELPAMAPVLDPRPDPTGSRVAYVSGGGLRVIGADGSGDQSLAGPEEGEVTWGLAEFVAAEEMGRTDGYWWAPDGERLLVARVDPAPVQRWYIADPADPARPPSATRYPAAGTPNAEVSLWVVGLGGPPLPISWDSAGFEYVVAAAWAAHGLLVAVQSRDQRRMQVLSLDPSTGASTVLREEQDPAWVGIVPGVPRLTAAGDLVWVSDAAGTKSLVVADEVVTPPGLQVRSVLDIDGEVVLLSASSEPTEVEVWAWSREGGLNRVSPPGGVHSGRRAGGTTVIFSRSLDHHGVNVEVGREGRVVAGIRPEAETPVVTPAPQMLRLGESELRASLLLPSWHRSGEGRLPVLLDPYGGPGAQRVLASRGAYLVSQWFAEQGFAVLVADGRGTPGRGPAWERAVRGDLATPVLEDQVEALQQAAASCPDLDLGRVGIRGWSFGGYLAALGVLRRPDAFHAAVAGAPFVDPGLYDTHYTERYLGHPGGDPGPYQRCSLVTYAPDLCRPLLIIHGLSDDNVVVAHSLHLSSALVAAGRPHCFLPLPGVTHMTPQEEVAENLLLIELDFLKRALARPGHGASG